ncbi:pyridoxamine 5'-phosphate oxidase family protein [Candidatus Haliotispira prima]|uniref:Pyridoxamine 5'-phosphate oxidase family protein n=1 Tax=Candidatus Haliotispira prima TaxID=3034016 RepID=A0ABY8MF81_9SPIO|nr:pyridoxamine 5'-phosphate oxidase family protein [Candidatus Haliotispira prima]
MCKAKKVRREFPQNFRSVVLATNNENGEPHTSYATCIHKEFGDGDECFYILISEMAPHYQNIRQHMELSLMLLEDEQSAKSIFFRKRLSYYCKTHFIETTEALRSDFVQRLGPAAKSMMEMDFHIVECRPRRGGLVLGPGMAYRIQGSVMTQDTGSKSGGHNSRTKPNT